MSCNWGAHETSRHWCDYHGVVEVLLPVDWGQCDHCGHVWRDVAEWRRDVGRCPEPRVTLDGVACPLCLMMRSVVRQ